MTDEAIDKAWTEYVSAQYGPPQALRKREFIAGWKAAQEGLAERDAEKWDEGAQSWYASEKPSNPYRALAEAEVPRAIRDEDGGIESARDRALAEKEAAE